MKSQKLRSITDRNTTGTQKILEKISLAGIIASGIVWGAGIAKGIYDIANDSNLYLNNPEDIFMVIGGLTCAYFSKLVYDYSITEPYSNDFDY